MAPAPSTVVLCLAIRERPLVIVGIRMLHYNQSDLLLCLICHQIRDLFLGMAFPASIISIALILRRTISTFSGLLKNVN